MSSDRDNLETGEPNGVMPDTILRALTSASREVSGRETWVPQRNGAMSEIVSRMVAAMHGGLLSRNGPLTQPIREQSIRLFAYLPVELRLAAIMNVVRSNPQAIDDMLGGRVRPEFEIYRYNILASLGVFARHGLVEEVFTRDRIRSVGNVLGRRKSAGENE